MSGMRLVTTHGAPLDLSGLAEAWEGAALVRSRYRECRRLFEKSHNPDDHDPPTHVKEAAHNHPILKPILYYMSKLLSEDGGIQLFTISQIETQILACRNSCKEWSLQFSKCCIKQKSNSNPS